MTVLTSRTPLLLLSLAAWLAVAGCASQGGRAPVEDRMPASSATRPGPAASAPAPALAASAPPGIENLGKPGYYAIRPGDTLARVALDHGQNWRDVARWNGIDNPNVIEVGQVLRVAPPNGDGVAVAQPVTTASRIETRPLDARPMTGEQAAQAASAASGVPPAPPSTTSPATPVAAGDGDINWLWPAQGPVIANFDESRNVKGLAIGGKLGDPVIAAAEGRVVYAGSGLRGYGNLVIVKHNNTYLSAYAHNQTLLVREDQIVRRGQKIAEMGSSDADRVQLHFEIRRLGKPVDPARLLPAR